MRISKDTTISQNSISQNISTRDIASENMDEFCQKICIENGALFAQIIPLKQPITLSNYKDWLEKKHHGEMTYLQDHLPYKENPKTLSSDKELRSVITMAFSYLPHPYPKEIFPGLKIAKYAMGEDYHHWLKKKLESISAQLKLHFPQDEFLTFTDSGPVLERDLAAQGGLGWFGKNTCIINRQHGSFFLLGEIFTTASSPQINSQSNTESTATSKTLSTNQNASVYPANSAYPANSSNSTSPFYPSKDFCGHCTRCLEACPTGALTAPHQLDARLCISYHTIESRQIAPTELSKKFGDLFFGCDICQDVCPWNKKPLSKFMTDHKSNLELTKNSSANANTSTAERVPSQQLIEDLTWILTASGKQIEKRIKGSALARSGSFGLKRNAIVVARNLNLRQLIPIIQTLTSHTKLGALATQAIQELQNI